MMNFEEYARVKSMKGEVAQSWIEPFLKYYLKERDPQSQRILDYGFGDGRYFEYFQQYFERGNIYGVEVSQTRVERAHAKGWQNAIYLDLAQPLPFADRFFDFINMVEVIEHIPTTKRGFYLGELHRVLSLDGVLILTTPNYPVKRAYDWIDAFRLCAFKRLRDDPTHVAFYNHAKLKTVLSHYFGTILFFPYKEGRIYHWLKADWAWHKILAVCAAPLHTQDKTLVKD